MQAVPTLYPTVHDLPLHYPRSLRWVVRAIGKASARELGALSARGPPPPAPGVIPAGAQRPPAPRGRAPSSAAACGGDAALVGLGALRLLRLVAAETPCSVRGTRAGDAVV
ncbi:unnamed protein product [Lampetra planeri]